jgi:light-regulated signal transduction histidine kinase (bacteriophytochrome)
MAKSRLHELSELGQSVWIDFLSRQLLQSGELARMMEEEFGDRLPPEGLHYLGRVVESAQKMGSLIDALLSFSRIQRQSMQFAPIDMTELVTECWASLASARAGRDIDFILPTLPPALGDRRLIQQVWVNLLDNAIKYTARQIAPRVEVSARIQRGKDPRGAPWGQVAVESHAPDLGRPRRTVAGWLGDWVQPDLADDTVLYTVRDNGAGFDMRYASKIGQVFQRLHHTSEFTGIGIGLALVQRIVQRHGGMLIAIGAPEAGATFGFSLRSSA